jgi:hypothetical protein
MMRIQRGAGLHLVLGETGVGGGSIQLGSR